MSAAILTITAGEIRRLGHAALARHTDNLHTCNRVIESLLRNQVSGYHSHGLLRLPEYLDDIIEARVNANTTPEVLRRSATGFEVNGRRSLGVLAADAVVDTLLTHLGSAPLIAVSLLNSHHIGRLADIARPVADAGYLIMGYCNYLGAGQKVIPPGNHEGKLCTNPMVFAAPRESAPPIILDMTTSTVAEGKIRSRWLEDKPAQDGWLVDSNFQPVTDTTRLYSEPPSAFMTPLGGSDHGYKGFGLAMFCEIFGGIVTGAQFCGQGPSEGGNGGMFIGFRPALFGQTGEQVSSNIDLLSKHILAGGENRLPGHNDIQERITDDLQLNLASTIVEYLENAATQS